LYFLNLFLFLFIKILQTELRDTEQSVQLIESEKKDLQDERQNLMKLRAQLEITVKELEDSQLTEDEYQVIMEIEREREPRKETQYEIIEQCRHSTCKSRE
jgi:hypothetical protein